MSIFVTPSETPSDPAAPAAVKIFGREPAAWIGLIEAVLAILLAFGLGISQTTFGPIMAVVVAIAGVYTAWVTRQTILAVILGLVRSLLILGAVFQLNLTDGQTAGVIGLVTVVIGFFLRDRTSPVAYAPAPVAVTELAA